MNYQCPHCGNLISVPDSPRESRRVRTAETRIAAGRIAVAWALTGGFGLVVGLWWMLAMALIDGGDVPLGLLRGLAAVAWLLGVALSIVLLWVGLSVYRLVAGLADRD